MRRAIYVIIFGSLACGPEFYQAPPPLGSYPERLSTKRWQQLFAEAAPLDPALPEGGELDVQCRNLPLVLAKLDAMGRVAEFDRLLKLNRDGDYSSARANLLWELRELAEDDATFRIARSYLAWRVRSSPKLPPRPPAECPWNVEKEDWAAMKEAYALKIDEVLDELDRGIEEAPPELRPNWRIQRGAFLFRVERFTEAAAEFTAVLPPVPAEGAGEGGTQAEPPPVSLTRRELAATIMLARCEIEQARRIAADPANDEDAARMPELRLAATGRLKSLIEIGRKHPHPYVTDAYGWLGAIAADSGDFAKAVEHQLDRLEVQPTREVTRTVLRECDGLFGRMIDKNAGPENGSMRYLLAGDFCAARIARHPLIARLFVQHAIDPAADVELPLRGDNETGDRFTIDFLKQRILIPRPFIGHALRELGRELLVQSTRLDGTTLTLLAWAAMEAGEHEQALALLDRIPAGRPTDEVLHARATVLRRMGRHGEAVAAYDQLSATYPASPLTNDLPFQRALEQFRAGRVSQSITGLARVRMAETAAQEARWKAAANASNVGEGTDGVDPPEIRPKLQPEYHLIQWLDTLAQFAPLKELGDAVVALPQDAALTEELRGLLRARALAAGDFALAKQQLSTLPEPPRNEWEGSRYSFGRALHLDAAKWATRAAPLEKLSADLAAAATPADKTRLHLALAREWLAQRGFLTLPATGACYYANSEEAAQDQLRRRNGMELGFARDTVEAELDRRDEATHALEHALAAAESRDPAIAAPALELANECLFRRAECSFYQQSRALETRATERSRSLYDQLRQRFPASAEARRAVYHVFTPPGGRWMPGDYSSANSVNAMIAAFDGIARPDPWEPNEAADALHDQIVKLPTRFDNPPPGTRLKDLRRDLHAAQRQLDTLRTGTDPDSQDEVLAAIDRLDDLTAAAALPDITLAEFTDYATGRHDKLPPQFKSLLDFRGRLEPVKDENDVEQGPANDTIAGWREFLETYPDSPKREAASLRLTRLIARQSRGAISVRAFHFPEAPIPNGYKRISVERPQPNSQSRVVIEAILDHQSNHSTGRYQDDLDLLRAGALTDAGEPGQALLLLEKVLGNPAQRDLHPVALLNLGEIAQHLLDPAKRGKAAAAFRAHPTAMDILRRLIRGDTCLSRLAPLLPWLEQASAKSESPPR